MRGNFLPNFIQIRFETTGSWAQYLKKVDPTKKKKNKNNKISRDMRLVPDPKI